MGWAGRSCSLKQHGLSVEQRWTSNFNCNFTERAANTGPLLISILAFQRRNIACMPFGYCGSLYHFLATPCRQVDRQTKYCTPYCNPHACALPTLSSLQISCTKEKYKEQFRVSNPCSSSLASIRLARLPGHFFNWRKISSYSGRRDQI